jgi:hypothetical protein
VGVVALIMCICFCMQYASRRYVLAAGTECKRPPDDAPPSVRQRWRERCEKEDAPVSATWLASLPAAQTTVRVTRNEERASLLR